MRVGGESSVLLILVSTFIFFSVMLKVYCGSCEYDIPFTLLVEVVVRLVMFVECGWFMVVSSFESFENQNFFSQLSFWPFDVERMRDEVDFG